MDIPAHSIAVNQPPEWRNANSADYLYFFIGVPVGIAVLFSLVGIRLTVGMPYLGALGYMILHMFLTWWVVSAGAYFVRFLCRSWRPPVSALCIMGFVITVIPATLSFKLLGVMYAGWYPEFAANMPDVAPSWTIEYLSRFVRYSIPALPLYMAGVYGYRALCQVNWLGYPDTEVRQRPEVVAVPETPTLKATAALIEGTSLPADAELIAIKAEQHYIQIWSDQGKDLVRYRFRDLAEALAECDGDQVHRSWWVNYGRVSSASKSGRSIELLLDNKLSVPVSLANRNTVAKALEGKVDGI